MNFPSDDLPLADGVPAETARFFKMNALRLTGQPDLTTLPAAEGRALGAQNDLFFNTNPLPVALVLNDVVGGVPVRRYKHTDASNGVVLFIHGGGWAFGSVDTHDGVARALTRTSKCEVISVEYRRTPEHPYPACLDDCLSVYRALVAKVLPSNEIVIAGDSAGAHLCLQLMLALPTQTLPSPAGACLFYGVYDDDTTTPSHRHFGPGGFGLTTVRMVNYWNWCIPSAQREQTGGRPLRDASDEALAALPPLWLTSAGLDCLKSDTLRLLDRLRAAGHVEHTHEEILGVPHGHLLPFHHLKATRDLLAVAGTKIRNFLA